MPGETWNKSPEEWQSLVVRLLALKHGPGNFVPIPDQVQGDCGLEGFTRDGLAFQCYAAEEPATTAQLTQRQKAKISADLQKLITYKDTLLGLLGPTVLSKWILVVPRWADKALLVHAESRIDQIRQAQLPFVAQDMVPAICTLDDYVEQRQMLIQAGRDSLRIEVDPVALTDVADWVSANDPFVAHLFRKALTIRHGDETTARQLTDHFVRFYLDGQNALTKLRDDFPELYEIVDRMKKDKEHFLATESLVTPELAPTFLKQTTDDLESQLCAKLQGLDRFTVKQFVQEAISDWLLRCPLDFPTAASNGTNQI